MIFLGKLQGRIIIREVNSEGKKVKGTEQIWVSLKEAQNCFIKTHCEYKIRLSKFCELRPKNIKSFDHIPCNVCVCLLLLTLKEHTNLSTDFQGFILPVTNPKSLV